MKKIIIIKIRRNTQFNFVCFTEAVPAPQQHIVREREGVHVLEHVGRRGGRQQRNRYHPVALPEIPREGANQILYLHLNLK